METQNPNPVIETSAPTAAPAAEYQPGTMVIYGLHGKCAIAGIETRTVGNESLRLYKLEVQKPAASRSTRQEPAIWVPIAISKERGLRLPMTLEQIDAAYKMFANREYYYSLNESWSVVHPKLEAAVRNEGGIGLAKVISYLFVLKHKQVVPSMEVARMIEQVNRLFFREVCESTNKQPKTIDTEINKLLRQKLRPDS